MENYFNAKKRLFEIADVGVINVDDIYGRQLSLIAKCHVVTCSLMNDKADFSLPISYAVPPVSASILNVTIF